MVLTTIALETPDGTSANNTYSTNGGVIVLRKTHGKTGGMFWGRKAGLPVNRLNQVLDSSRPSGIKRKRSTPNQRNQESPPHACIVMWGEVSWL